MGPDSRLSARIAFAETILRWPDLPSPRPDEKPVEFVRLAVEFFRLAHLFDGKVGATVSRRVHRPGAPRRARRLDDGVGRTFGLAYPEAFEWALDRLVLCTGARNHRLAEPDEPEPCRPLLKNSSETTASAPAATANHCRQGTCGRLVGIRGVVGGRTRRLAKETSTLAQSAPARDNRKYREQAVNSGARFQKAIYGATIRRSQGSNRAKNAIFMVSVDDALDESLRYLVRGRGPRVMKILVIDDHVLIRQAMQGVLRKLRRDAAVLEAANYKQAKQAIADNHDIGLILLDLTLPDRDGFSVLSELREKYPAISVVVLSAVQDATNVRKALDLGALGYIPKSAEGDVMVNALRLVMSGGVYIPPELLARETVPATPLSPRGDDQRPGLASGNLLTDRQLEVLSLLMQGKSNKMICRTLNLTEPTVKGHVSAIMKALNASNRTEAVIAANQLGLNTPEIAKQ